MKKKILFSGIILLFGIMPWFTFCDPCLGNPFHKGEWYVKNLTEQTLHVTDPLGGLVYKVAPGDSVETDRMQTNGCYDPERLLNFYSRFESHNWNEYSLRVLSEGNALLKEWKYSERGLPGRQYFNESFQHSYEFPPVGNKTAMTVWTFDILPEDIE